MDCIRFVFLFREGTGVEREVDTEIKREDNIVLRSSFSGEGSEGVLG